MERYRELEQMLCDEIDQIAERKELNNATLERLDTLAHTLKSIKTIDAMDEYEDGYAHDSMAYRGRRNMGRYASYDGRYR